MYIEALVVFSFLILSGFVLTILNLDKYLSDIYGCIKIILALIGNSLYYSKINKVIKKLSDIEIKDHNIYLKKHGGTNIVPAIIIELLLSGIVVLSIIL